MSEIDVGSDVFRVDLQQLQDAITRISQDRDGISEDFSEIVAQFDALQSAWQGPAATSYEELRIPLQNATGTTLEVLGDMISRMQTSYDNYENTETTNARNLNP